MGNIEYNDGPALTGRTHKNDNESTILLIPEALAKNLQIENSKVLMSMLEDFDGNRHLLVSKFSKEIVID